ncbi:MULTISPECIES: helix-turn-helix domain-containing protein [unclassified Kitasatospora]|uniref:TetR/AcrR family transcriptional regulator n=1 Tax=unclassified Kitasatospora TaxID=2633591 RepID=UPI0033FFAA67
MAQRTGREERTDRTERADALRNREAVLAAADALFAASSSPHSVSMDDIAAAAGVGKGTLFRRFGDRAGLIGAVIASRLEPLRAAQDAAAASPRQRVPDLLDAALRFKIENRNLMAAAEGAGLASPYQAAHYAWWHGTLREALERVPGVRAADFTAHALPAAVRADLVAHLIDDRNMTPEALRSALAAHLDNVLGSGSGSPEHTRQED